MPAIKKHTTRNPIGKYFLNQFTNTLISETKKLKPQSILDVGAGEGLILKKLQDKNIGETREGIEPADSAIALAKKLHPEVVIKKGTIYKLPYHDKAFDVVICANVLEHLDRPKTALTELKRVTNKYLVLSVPNEPFFTIQRVLRGKNVLKLGDEPSHIQHWSSGSFKKFVSTKIKVKKMKTPLPWTFIVAEK